MTFRAKLLTIVGATALAFILLIVVSTVISGRVSQRMDDIERRLVPKAALGPRLEAELDHLRHSMQDAVAAQDTETLAGTKALRDKLLDALAAGSASFGPAAVAAARAAIDDYYQAAHDVSRRLIGGETGESIVEAMTAMQARQTRAATALKEATRLDDKDLAVAFAEVRRASETGAALRAAIGIVFSLMVLALSIGLSRSVLRNVKELSIGLARFGRGDFTSRLPVTSEDELGSLATVANQMADSLGRLASERDRND